ncbi:MAG: sulfite exporter TauE/SafE family protein, partial [Myxococcota bacterium]
NSFAGLAGIATSTGSLPGVALPLAGAVVVGGLMGSWLGSRWMADVAIRRVLAAVLVVAGARLLLTL